MGRTTKCSEVRQTLKADLVRLSNHSLCFELSQAPFRRLLDARIFVLPVDCSRYGLHQDITRLLSSQIMVLPETSSFLSLVLQASFHLLTLSFLYERLRVLGRPGLGPGEPVGLHSKLCQ